MMLGIAVALVVGLVAADLQLLSSRGRRIL